MSSGSEAEHRGHALPLEEQWEPTPEIVFLQLLLAASYISKTELQARTDEINSKCGPGARPRTLEDIQKEANLVFDAMGMSLIQVRDDFEDGEAYYTVVTRESIPKFLNKIVMAPPHALQLKGMLERMFSSANCMGITVNSLPISNFPARAQIIAQMVEEKRFVFIEEEQEEEGEQQQPLDRRRIFIGTRLLYEIEDYLKETYGGKTLHKCIGCDQWVLKGRLCSNPNCPGRLHDRCYEAYFNSKGLPSGVCPLCSSPL